MAKKKTFEESMKRLEQIIAELEKGDIELEKSLAYFTEGIEMVKNCKSELTMAEEKVKVLIEKELVDFSQLRGE